MLRETVEEKETRVQRVRFNQRLRLASETQEERETCLQRMRQRTASEIPEDRETRLQRMQQRLASESPEDREIRLQQMCLNQQQRLASEAPEHREERHQLDREWHRRQREINPLLPLLQRPAVHSNMIILHYFISLHDTPTHTCILWLGMRVNSPSPPQRLAPQCISTSYYMVWK